MSWTQEKVGRETYQKPLNRQVQRIIHFFRLNTTLECQTCITEENTFKLFEARIHRAKLFKTIGALKRNRCWIEKCAEKSKSYPGSRWFLDRAWKQLSDRRETRLVCDFHLPLIAIAYAHRQVYSAEVSMKS